LPPKRISPYIAKKIGNWDGAIEFFRTSGYRVKTVALKAQEEICREYKKRLINHIISQDLNWQPLSERTRERKNPKNKDLILIDTELYVKSISITRMGNTWMTGIKKGIAYKRKGSFINLDRVAVLNEFGTTKVPERPLWEPTLEELGGPKGIRNFVANAIYEKLKQQANGKPIQITKSKILGKITNKK
jgi:hypothetical protein